MEESFADDRAEVSGRRHRLQGLFVSFVKKKGCGIEPQILFRLNFVCATNTIGLNKCFNKRVVGVIYVETD